ncbi:MAG: recombinase family protein, partial [Stackebrandtia sp.]
TKASKGKWPGGPRPYGYGVDEETDKLTPDDSEAALVREIFRLYTRERLGVRAIAAELNRRGLRKRSGKPWCGMGVSRVLDNPACIGAIVYRDVEVQNAHERLIEQETWDRAREIATARADTHKQRAMTVSDYHLTGLITCPECGNKYIGTVAHGRTRRYQYYTCHSRIRYGTAGCKAPRLIAPATDEAALQALHDFYHRADQLIADAITEAQQQRRNRYADQHSERDDIDTKIATKSAAIDRYHAAFEAGTMDHTECGPRVKKLRDEIAQLHARRDEITDTLGADSDPPPGDVLEDIRQALTHVIANGTPAERKAIIETLVADIRIQGIEIIPTFK